MTIRNVERYILNPGIGDVYNIIRKLLNSRTPAYAVGQSGNHWNITKMNGKLVHAGSMWIEEPNADPLVLCVDSFDPVFTGLVENENDVKPLKRYEH